MALAGLPGQEKEASFHKSRQLREGIWNLPHWERVLAGWMLRRSAQRSTVEAQSAETWVLKAQASESSGQVTAMLLCAVTPKRF